MVAFNLEYWKNLAFENLDKKVKKNWNLKLFQKILKICKI